MTEETRYKPALLEVETDPLPPQIQLLGPKAMSLGLGTPYVEEGATALDNVDGDLTASVVISSTLDVNVPGEYTIEYDVEDSAGNEAITTKRTVFVTFGQDERPPGMTAEGCDSASGGCFNEVMIGDAYVDPGVDAFDDYDLDQVTVVAITYLLNDIVYDVMKAGSITFAPCFLGTGCLSEADVTNAKAGDGAVVLSGTSGTYYVLEVAEDSPNEKLVWEQVKTFDIEAGDMLAGSISAATGGVYVTKYNAEDKAGNIADELDRLVVIKDSPPSIVMTGAFRGDFSQGIRLGGTYVELGAVATDVEDGDLTDSIVIGGDVVDVNTLGDYTVTYDVTDSFGNAAEQQIRKITVYEEFTRQEQDTAAEEVSDFTSGGCFISGITPE